MKQVDRYQFEKQLWSEGFKRVMGLDEVGRGCLAGPVVAAGVILKPGTDIDGFVDSKSIDEPRRRELAEIIKSEAAYWTIHHCSPKEIDELNILWASLRAMEKCTEADGATPDYLLVDGNRYLATLMPHKCIVKGDDRSGSIAAASILAKVHRDDLMREFHQQFPHYGWDTNVGYPTARHYAGLTEYGITPHHRTSFKLRTEKIYSAAET